jgi:putative phosphoribosyl transferase
MLTQPLFRDRIEAGRILGQQVKAAVWEPHPVVLALPRGGVPIGFEVAKGLHADLDIFIVRKLGVPGHEELAMGAIASGGVRVLNEELIRDLRLPSRLIEIVAAKEQLELARRELLYREGRPPIPLSGRPVILVDDGLATGATMLAAARALRQQKPGRIVVAVPVAAPDACEEFQAHVDEVICAFTPEPFHAVGIWYEDFAQTSDAEVRELLERCRCGSCCPTVPGFRKTIRGEPSN